MTEFKETTNRHLRHKIQSLARRLDELEEATNKLQKTDDELLDLQDKIIQAEGSNSSLLGDVEALRKRILKIEGKDEEVRKAEELCRSIKEKLEEEENVTRDLKKQIECLQSRIAKLEKLEEAFGMCKSDCTQLTLSLNEEKNLTRKVSSELEALKAKIKETDSTELHLNKAEQTFSTELEKLKCLTQTFIMERKNLLDKQKEDEKIILKLTEKLERWKTKLSLSDLGHNDSSDLYIEDSVSPELSSKLSKKQSPEYKSSDNGLRMISENEKYSLEDNRVRDLTQEVENLKRRLKHLEMVEEDFKNLKTKNAAIEEKFQLEKSRNQSLSEELEQLKIQQLNSSSNGSLVFKNKSKVLENGKAESEETNNQIGFRQEKPKYKSGVNTESVKLRYKYRDVSPHEQKSSKEISQSTENSPKTVNRAPGSAQKTKTTGSKTGYSATSVTGPRDGRGIEKLGSIHHTASSLQNENKKASLLGRYPPSASDQNPSKISVKHSFSESKKSKSYNESDFDLNSANLIESSTIKAVSLPLPDTDRSSQSSYSDPPLEANTSSLSSANEGYTRYRSHHRPSSSTNHSLEAQPSVELESSGSKHQGGELESVFGSTLESERCKNPNHGYISLQDSHSQSYYDKEQHRSLSLESGCLEPIQPSTGVETQQVYSPRESLCSKVIIKPTIMEYNRKEIMSGGSVQPQDTTEKPRLSTKLNKMTSSITFYPTDPSTSQVSSDMPSRERHTSTSNIVIGASNDLRGSITVPYEISFPKSGLAPRSDEGEYDPLNPSGSQETSRIQKTVVSKSNFKLQSQDKPSDLNDHEISDSNITTPVTSCRGKSSNGNSPQENKAPEIRNVTVRRAWRNQGAVLSDPDSKQGGLDDDDDDDDSESTTILRAYKATTVMDMEEARTPLPTRRSGKPTPAEMYMSRISGGKETHELVHSNRSVPSSLKFHKSIPHEPVSAQKMEVKSQKERLANEGNQSVTSWRKQASGDLKSSPRTSRRSPWSDKSSSAERSRPWNSRSDN